MDFHFKVGQIWAKYYGAEKSSPNVTKRPKLFIARLYLIRVSYIFLVSPHIQICTKYNIKLSVSYQFHCVSASVSPLYLDSASSH